MVFSLRFIAFLTLYLFSLAVHAQFYTISADTSSIILLPGYNEKEYVYKQEKNDTVKVNIKINNEDYFPEHKGREISIEKDVPVFVNLTDSLLMGLIQQRMNVCLPLDFLKVNSNYGTRIDPIGRCEKFHDGIDLKCNREYVYSMLPGIVKTVRHGKKGYGNYVIIDYGNIQSLYGHMSVISVSEGMPVAAGTIVGISGNSGKSTGPHLHIQLMKNGKSVNPAPFIAYIKRYIEGLQDKIAYLKFGTKPAEELNIKNLHKALSKYNIAHKEIVIAQALLETGYFTSRVCWENNNLFGLRRPSDGSYYVFNNWEESVKAYYDYVQYKYKGGDYLSFLSKIGYAEDKNYISKVRSIVQALKLP